jgi:phenylalanine-4-hydroxylase
VGQTAEPQAEGSWAARRGARLPRVWRSHVTAQRHEDYTASEHETWRRLVAATAALVTTHEAKLHPAYVEGFRRLVLPWSEIPALCDVNEALSEFGWSTVCVDGYLPAEVYSGLVASGIFPVSRNIRRAEHLAFSPLPDLAHDLIGHIPMLISPDHRRFLRRLSRAIATTPAQPLDRELYQANRQMALLVCQLPQEPQAVVAAEARVEATEHALAMAPTRLSRLERLYLWSIEFGLMGTREAHGIYGAGLLSSPAETAALCAGGAPVVELSSDASERPIDFSAHQSVYFVARDYAQLDQALEALVDGADDSPCSGTRPRGATRLPR